MDTKKFTQFGTVSILILLPITLIFGGIAVKSGFTWKPESFIPFLVSLVMLICLLTFYKLTITINKQQVSFRLGIGWFGKSYRLSDIRSCRPVTNSALTGFGIRRLRNGWLYNVTGFRAIELAFNNRNSVVRIGCSKPDEISNLIHSLTGKESTVVSVGKSNSKWSSPLWVILIVVVLLLTVVPLFQEARTEIRKEEFKIRGVYGMTIPYSEIIQIDTIPVLPAITLRTNGYALGNTLIGNFRLSDKTQARLFVKKGLPPFVLIRSNDRVPVYINFKDKMKTINLYNNLVERHESLP